MGVHIVYVCAIHCIVGPCEFSSVQFSFICYKGKSGAEGHAATFSAGMVYILFTPKETTT